MKIPSIAPSFPVLHDPWAAQVLDAARQLRRLERMPAQGQAAVLGRQRQDLLRHAYAHSPFWRHRLGDAGFDAQAGSFKAFSSLPVLTRDELQQEFGALRARLPGQKEGDFMLASTSGSSGQPVRVEKLKALHRLLYEAVGLIDTEWHRRDPSQTLAVLAFASGDAEHDSWGGIYPLLGYRGNGLSRGLSSRPMASHLDWLVQHRPGYLKCSPLAAAELAQLALSSGVELPIRQVISQSERVLPVHRALCRQAFGASIKDRYSSEETGWIALQCPKHEHLHVMSGVTQVEIVDDAGAPCAVGQPGRVLVTSLHSYAMPLIRYELGDMAEWGGPCDCGIGLPVIRRLWGRTRHRLRLPSGELRPMPALGDDVAAITAVRAFQLRQYRGGEIEMVCKASRRLSPGEAQALAHVVRKDVCADLEVFVREVEEIDWGPGWKREEFVSVDDDYARSPRPA
ncbi:MAG: phenylacetate--CoA ligase family protein [Telluria sp.]